MAPLGARAADLVVWWEDDFHAQEDEAVAEIIAAFEQKTGKQVELVQPAQDEIFNEAEVGARGRAPARLPVRRHRANAGPPSGLMRTGSSTSRAFSTRSSTCSTPTAIGVSTLLDGSTGRRGLYALPMGRYSNHIHVWNSLLEQAGFTLADIPKEWEAFWSFWCDQVQPAARKALRRDDIWAVGLPCPERRVDTNAELLQFELAYDAPWLDLDRRLQVDDPEVRAGMIKSLGAYTADLAQGLHAARLGELDQHRQQPGIPRPDRGDDAEPDALDPRRAAHERPDDYYKNAATIDWPPASTAGRS